MGDVIEFKPSKKLVQLEAQMFLEEAITDTWARLGGIDLLMEIRAYHLAFLRFSDICFQLMEKELMIVDEDGTIEIEDKAISRLKYYLKQLEKESE